MKTTSIGLLSLAAMQIVFWICVPQISEGKCPTLTRVGNKTEMSLPWWRHIYAFIAAGCTSESDQADTGVDTFPRLLKRLIKNSTNSTSRHTNLSEINEKFLARVVTTSGQISKTELEAYCRNPTFIKRSNTTDGDFARKFPKIHPKLELILKYADTDTPGNPAYTTAQMIEELPEHDYVTKFSEANGCRKEEFGFFPCPPKVCEILTDVTVMPTTFVNLIKRICGIIVNDVELLSDPEVVKIFEFDDVIKDIRSSDFFDGVTCLPYNKTVRAKIKKHLKAYSKNRKVFEVHANRISRKFFYQQLIGLIGERSVKLLREGGDCSGSFDYLDLSDRFLKYLNEPIDGSFPFEELAYFETPKFKLVMAEKVDDIFKKTCNFTLRLFCNDKCRCECPKGKGNCETVDSLGTHSTVNHLVALIALVNLGLVSWTTSTTFWWL